MKKIKKLAEAFATCWGAITKGAVDCSQCLMAVAAVVHPALAELRKERMRVDSSLSCLCGATWASVMKGKHFAQELKALARDLQTLA